MKELIETLKDTFPFFNYLHKDKLNEFISKVYVMDFSKGSVILNEGAYCDNMVLILHGSVRVYKLSPNGKEITLYHLGSGETCILVVSCLMGNTNYPAIAEVEETVKLVIIPAAYYKKLFSEEPLWQSFIFNTLSNRLMEVMLLIDEVVFKSIDTRLAVFLLERLTNKDNNQLELTHEKIAFELGTAREVISRILKNFEKKGILSLSRGKILINNIEDLKKISDM